MDLLFVFWLRFYTFHLTGSVYGFNNDLNTTAMHKTTKHPYMLKMQQKLTKLISKYVESPLFIVF